MTWLTDAVMQLVLLITAALMIAAIMAVVVQRGLRRGRLRREAVLDAQIRPLVLTATVCEDDELPELLERIGSLDSDARAHVRRTVLGMLRDVTGEAAVRLRAVADAAGMVPAVMAAVGHRRVANRADAAEALGLLRPPGALPRLRRLAQDRSPEVRGVAVRALGAFDDPSATSVIVAALGLGSGVSNGLAASALLQQGLSAGDAVRRALDDPDVGVRHGAARVAGILQVAGAGESLARLLHDEHESVRLAAVRSLERVPVRSAVPRLLQIALADGVEGEAAAAALVALPGAWTGAALEQLSAHGTPAARRAAGLPAREAFA
jgi:HEAT repeat protein